MGAAPRRAGAAGELVREKVVPLSRFVAVVRRSFPELTDAERAALLERVGELKNFEGLSDDGRARLAETRARLLGM